MMRRCAAPHPLPRSARRWARPLSFALLAAVLLGVAPLGAIPHAAAQLEAPAGHLGVYFDPRAEDTTRTIGPFAEFELYVLADFDARPAPSGVQMGAWEASIEVDPRVTVTRRELNPANALNVGPQFQGSPDDFAVGLGTALDPGRSPVKLVTYTCILLASGVEDARVTVAATDVMPGHSFQGRGPGWAIAENTPRLVPFYSWSGAVINPPVERWGEIKQKYRDG